MFFFPILQEVSAAGWWCEKAAMVSCLYLYLEEKVKAWCGGVRPLPVLQRTASLFSLLSLPLGIMGSEPELSL